MRAFLCLLCLVAAACAPRQESGPALWRVSDADSNVWIFGSVHMLPANVDWRSEAVLAAFDESEVLVVETDVSPEGEAQLGQLAATYAFLPAGETLESRLDPEARARLTRAAADLGIDPRELSQLPPWVASLRLALAQAQRDGHSVQNGVETVLTARANAQGKAVRWIETPEEQIRALADLGPDDEARLLAATLRQIEQEPESLDEMDAAWARGDLAALDALTERQLAEAGPAVYESLIVTRNRRFAEAIVAELAGEEDVFVAVGAAHLLGEDSAIAMLRSRGLTVEGPVN